MAPRVSQRIASLNAVPFPEEEGPLLSYARRLMVVVAATCLIAAVAAPTAGAAGSHSGAKAAASAKKQARANAAVTKKRLAQGIRRNSRRITATRRALTTAGAQLRKLVTDGDASIDAKINGIVATVAPVLTQLGDGLIALRDGSLLLKAGLEELAAKTIAGFEQVKTDVTAGFDQVEV